MKNFSLKKKENFRRSSRNEILKVIGVAIVLVLILVFGRQFISGFISSITTPAYLLRSWFLESSATVPSYFRDRYALLGEIEKLNETIAASSGNAALITKLTAENTALADMALNTLVDERILAGVVARPPYLPYDAVMLDRGARDGINEGALVYQSGDHAIGIVSRAYESSALVSLFSTPGIETTVFIIGPDIYTTAYGNGGGVVRVSVPQGIMLTEGDVVLLPALPGSIIGTISAIRSEATRPEQDAFIVGTLSMQSLRTVTVGTRVLEKISFDEAREALHGVRESYLKLEVPEGVLVEQASTTATSTEDGSASTTDADIE